MFELWEESQYRALDEEGIESRRAAILEQLDGESGFSMEELRGQVDLLEAEIERRNVAVQLRSKQVAAVQAGKGALIARSNPQEPAPADIHDSEQYRTAFMEYVCRSTPIPAEYRAAETTKVADAGAVIPTTLLNRIIREMDTYGNIWNRVTKLNVKGGVEIPIATIKPTASWVGEGASDSQKFEAKNKIVFAYHGLECKVAQTLLVATVTLSAFEDLFVKLAYEAMIKALEAAIIAGDGSGKPLGITKDTRVTKVVTMSPKELASWEAWHKKFKSQLKKAYRNGQFIMAQASYDAYIDGMVDANGNSVNGYTRGIDGEAPYRFMGKEVETVEEDLIKDFDTAEEGEVVAIFGVLSDYAVNTDMQITATKWIDHDTNEVKNKCLMYVDGKVVDPYGFILIKKGAEA